MTIRGNFKVNQYREMYLYTGGVYIYEQTENINRR